MKKIFLSILLMGTALATMAQQPQTPAVFHNHLEYMNYQLAHPERLPFQSATTPRATMGYSQKLDSILGSDDFDFTRWKTVYTFDQGESRQEGLHLVEIHYNWEDPVWVPNLKTELDYPEEGTDNDLATYYTWNGEAWESYQKVVMTYLTCGDNRLLKEATTYTFSQGEWRPFLLSTYEYDDECHPLLNMNYRVNGSFEFEENSKYEYTYNADGLLETLLYATIRNGNWRETQRDTLYYDNGVCTSVAEYSRMGFGGGWRLAGIYELEYDNGMVVTENCYGSTGWFSTDLTLQGVNRYEFDVLGNELRKTVSVFNEQDWIVRDVYENTFDNTVSASMVLGQDLVWQTTFPKGFADIITEVVGNPKPLYSLWRTCSISSQNLDTQFTLYCSGFAQVGDQQEAGFRAYGLDGRLVVESPQPCQVTVYDLLGRVVASQSQTSRGEFQLTPGLYLVSNGAQVIKAAVR